jgi:hypothetical protein
VEAVAEVEPWSSEHDGEMVVVTDQERHKQRGPGGLRTKLKCVKFYCPGNRHRNQKEATLFCFRPDLAVMAVRKRSEFGETAQSKTLAPQ